MEKEVTIKELHVKDGRIDMAVEHPIFAKMCEEIARLWHKTGGENYVELNCWTKATGPINIMIQRVEGKTPAQVNVELKAELARYREAVIWLYATTTGRQREDYDREFADIPRRQVTEKK